MLERAGDILFDILREHAETVTDWWEWPGEILDNPTLSAERREILWAADKGLLELESLVAFDTVPPDGSPADPSPWVPAATLWRDRFDTIRKVARFRAEHADMFRNPSPRRLEIHAAKWVAYWAGRNKVGFASLDGQLPSVADDPDVQDEALAKAMERAAAIRAKKKAGKQ